MLLLMVSAAIATVMIVVLLLMKELLLSLRLQFLHVDSKHLRLALLVKIQPISSDHAVREFLADRTLDGFASHVPHLLYTPEAKRVDAPIQQSEHLLLSNNIRTTALARNIHRVHQLLFLHLRLPALLQVLRLLRPRRRERLRAVRAVRADAVAESAVLAEAAAAFQEVRADLRARRRARRGLLAAHRALAVLKLVR